MSGKSKAGTIKKGELRRIAEKFDLDLIVLFGSQASPPKDPKSDTDIAVRRKARALTWKGEVRLIESLASQPGLGNMDLVVLNNADPLLMFEVASHGIPLYEQQGGTFREFQLYAVKRNNDAAKFYRLEQYYLEKRVRRW